MISIKGIIHVHSLYSYDGVKSIEEIKKTFKEIGVNFIIFTEHIEKLSDFGPSFISECKSLSDSDFIIIPGFEFKCENIEILGLNISKNFKYSGLDELISQIQKNGGLAILAHPHKYANISDSILSSLEKLDGIEVWNLRYDGSSPRMNNIILLKKLRLKKDNIVAFAGLDYHQGAQNIEHFDRPNFSLTQIYTVLKMKIKQRIFSSMELYHCMTVEKLNMEEIIYKLKKGEFYICYKNMKHDQMFNIKLYNYIFFKLLSLEYDFLLELMKIEKKILHFNNRKLR